MTAIVIREFVQNRLQLLAKRLFERRSTMLSTLARMGTQFADPFETLRREFAQNGLADGQFAPRTGFGHLSLWEDGDHVYLDMDLPGLSIDEIELLVEDGKLWIRGARRPTCRGQKCWRDERFYGQFERAIALSDSVDTENISAELANGILSVMLPKKTEAKAHRIPIQTGSPRIAQTS
jgi:HSP20 family protein